MPTQRGRKSAASKGLAVIDGGRGNKAAPPADLAEFEATVWQRVMTAMSAGWYSDEMEDLMRAYVRCVRTLRTIDRATDSADNPDMLGDIQPESLALLLRLANTRDKQVRQLAMLATKLRLTPQARVDPKTAGRAHRRGQERGNGKSGQPWDA